MKNNYYYFLHEMLVKNKELQNTKANRKKQKEKYLLNLKDIVST